MTGKNLRYIVNDDLSAYSTAFLLKGGGVRPPRPTAAPAGGGDANPPIPVSPDGKIRAGELYESSTEPSVKYFLPQYKLNKANELYTTSLKWRKPEDPPSDPVASLTIELVSEAPPAPGFTLREIEHTGVVRLGFRLPVEQNGQTAGSTADGAAGGEFILWKEAGSLEPVSATVRQGEAPGLLRSCWTPLGEPVSPTVRRARMAIHTKEDFDRIYQAMTDTRLEARLEIQCFATVGYRTWKQVFLRPVFSAVGGLNRPATVPNASSPAAGTRARPKFGTPRLGTTTSKAQSPTGKTFSATKFNTAAVRPAMVSPAMRPAAQPVALNTEAIAAMKPVRPLVRVVDAEAPVSAGKTALASPIALNAMLKVSDMKVKLAGIERAAVPVGVVVDDGGVPVLLRTTMEARQEIPFYFVKETNAYMFDLPESPSTNHFLYRHQIDTDSGQAIFYQDMGARDQFYYEPQEFRLARSAANPYLPDLRVILSEVVINDPQNAGAGTQANDVQYRANLVYEAVPFIDPGILNRARTSLGASESARFSALTAENSQLTLDLPEGLPDKRPDVEISFDRAFDDTVELSDSAFEQIFVWFRSGQGVKGFVEFTSPDGKPRNIPVKLSLQENAGLLFTVNRPVALPTAGEYGVTVTNRIESPVVLEQLYDVALAPGVTAVPLRPAPGVTVEPGANLQIDYRVLPADAPVTEIRPVLGTSIKPDHDLLWRKLFVNRGYTKQTFTLAVSVPREYFDSPPPEGMDVLTGVQVDFEPDARVVLTGEKLSETINLRMPLLDYLMAEGSAKRYRYRISTLHGSNFATGQTSDELTGEGETPLIIDLSQV